MNDTEMKNEKAENGNTAEFRQRIGKTAYIISLHFAEGQKETLEEKILRLARNDKLQYNNETGKQSTNSASIYQQEGEMGVR